LPKARPHEFGLFAMHKIKKALVDPDPAWPNSKQRWTRYSKFFEGILLLMMVAPALFITLCYSVVPLFGARGQTVPLLRSGVGYWVGLSAYLVFCLCAAVKMAESFDAHNRLPYARIVTVLGITGCVLLVGSVVIEMLKP
jgi:uncharacterized BrkB/YihY/UPF0761 family membrane protein